MPLSWNIERNGEPQAIELAHHIDGILAEASSAGWSEDELLQELAEVLPVTNSFGENRYGDPGPVAESNAASDFTHVAA